MVEHLLCKCQPLSSNPSFTHTHKKNPKKTKMKKKKGRKSTWVGTCQKKIDKDWPDNEKKVHQLSSGKHIFKL
jgi:hypothetical protein